MYHISLKDEALHSYDSYAKIEDLRPDVYMQMLFRDFVGIQNIFGGIIRIRDVKKILIFPPKMRSNYACARYFWKIFY